MAIIPAVTAPAAPTRRGLGRAPRAAALPVLAAAALWGTTGTAQVFGAVKDPVLVGAARLGVGGAALVLIAVVSSGPSALAACLRRPLLGWTVLAAVATAVYQSAFFSAVATGLCGAVLFGERLTRWWTGATALAVVGCIALVTAGSSGAAQVRPAGVAFAVVAGSCYRLYTCGAKALPDRRVPVVVAMGVTLGLGAVLLTPALVRGGTELLGFRSLVMVGWLGLVTTAGAYLLFARGLRHLPAGTVGTLSLAEPLTAATLGLFLLGERPAPRAAAGALSLLAGLLLAALRPTRSAPPATNGPAGKSLVPQPTRRPHE